MRMLSIFLMHFIIMLCAPMLLGYDIKSGGLYAATAAAVVALLTGRK